MSLDQWASYLSPWAQIAAANTGLPADSILTQWINESGAARQQGPTTLATQANNWAGIRYVHANTQDSQAAYEGGGYAAYDTMAHFVGDYSRVMGLSYYAHVREAARAQYANDQARSLAVLNQIEASPYATSHYGDPAGQLGQGALESLYQAIKAWLLVSGGPSPAPPPSSQPAPLLTTAADGSLLVWVPVLISAGIAAGLASWARKALS